jgi:hypothetical protein
MPTKKTTVRNGQDRSSITKTAKPKTAKAKTQHSKDAHSKDVHSKDALQCVSTASTVSTADVSTDPITRLINLYAKKQAIDAEMKQIKETLLPDISNSEKSTLKSEAGTITLKTTNAWSLPPVNESKARKVLGDSFSFYFKEKLSFGVETLGKDEINNETELGLQLKDLVEIKETQSWEIKPA